MTGHHGGRSFMGRNNIGAEIIAEMIYRGSNFNNRDGFRSKD